MRRLYSFVQLFAHEMERTYTPAFENESDPSKPSGVKRSPGVYVCGIRKANGESCRLQIRTEFSEEQDSPSLIAV